MKHRYLAASVDGVVQLIAASYLRHGYYWYVTGQIPRHKNPTSVDEKLIEKYQIDVSDWERSRRKKAGIANAQYVRCDRWFVIMVIRDGDWKLIEWYEDGALELYNLSQDIGEQKNLVTLEPKKANDMREQLSAWRKEVSALMPTPNTETKKNTETTKARRKRQAK